MTEEMRLGPVFSSTQIYCMEERKKNMCLYKEVWVIVLDDIDEESEEEKIKKEQTKTEALYAVFDDLYKVLELDNERPWEEKMTVSWNAKKIQRITWLVDEK